MGSKLGVRRGFIGPDTFFLSLTFANVREYMALPDASKQAMIRGVDVVELRVDLLESVEIDFVRMQLALLRRHLPLPILFTVRTRAEGGSFEGSSIHMFELMDMALRAGCEIIDIEVNCCWTFRLVLHCHALA